MGIVFRQSVKSSLVIAAGALLGALVTYAYSFVLKEDELGYLRNFIVLAAVFHAFLMIGTGSTIMNFSSRYGTNDERRKVLLTISATIPIIILAALIAPYFLFKEQILTFYQEKDRPLASTYYALVPIVILLYSYMIALECYLVTQSKVAVLSFIREIVLRIINMILVVLVFLKVISFSGFIYGITASYLVSVILLFVVSRKTKEFGFSFNIKVFNRADYKEIFQYSWYHMLVAATINLLGFIDQLLLSSWSPDGLSSLAVYGHAVFIVAIVAIPYKAMSQSAIPTLNRAYLSGNHKELSDIFHRSAINLLIASMAIMLVIICNLDNAVAILPENYAAIKPVALILIAGRAIDMCTGLNTELTSVSKYYKFNFRISVLLVAMLVLFCYVLIPRYGVYGAAWGTTISLALFNIAKMWFIWWKMKLQPFTSKSLLVFVAGLCAFVVGYLLPYITNPIVDTIVRSSATMLTYILMLLWLRPSEDLNSYMASIKANKRLF